MAKPSSKSTFKPPKSEVELLKIYPRPVVHMRAQENNNKLGLVFGAGINIPLDIPDWEKLIYQIARHRKVSGATIQIKAEKTNLSHSVVTQLLFHKFKENYKKRKGLGKLISARNERKINTEWLKLIHGLLYTVDEGSLIETIKSHPYLDMFIKIIKKMPMTVTYNFDEVLELFILHTRSGKEKKETRGYETVAGEGAQIRKRKGVIYHPNGFLASNFQNGTSQGITFSDESFADQLIDSTAGRYASLNHYFANTTCLFIGLSLEDGTLRHQLRQNARLNPGHYHYYVHYLPDETDIEDEVKQSIFESNFSVYNLITLFLGDKGIRSLASLITDLNSNSFQQMCEEEGVQGKYCYYLIGAVGVGKSTTNSYFKSINTHDEWMDVPPAFMSEPDSKLEESDREEVDKWVADQFFKKNFSIKYSREGIHVVDRTPLDPLTFGDPKRRQKKAATLLKKICPSPDGKIEKGHVIFLSGSIDEICFRLLRKHKEWDEKDVRDLQDQIKEIYTFPKIEISRIDTTNRSIEEVVREVAKIVFIYDYAPIDLKEKLESVAQGK